LTTAYIALSILGCGYVLIALLLGHGGDHGGHGGHDAHAGHDAHHGGHSDDMHYGVKGEGHGAASAGGGAASDFHFPFFSPLALATLFGALGAWGLIVQQGFGASDSVSLTIAVPAAVVTAYLVTYAGWRLVTGSQGSSQIRNTDLQGADAEVITPIPAGGIGEVAAMVGGQRFSGPAREADGKEIPRGAHVRVKIMLGGTFVVERKG
jgi:membrane protein implicated in regulation of membrane protease activity